MTARTTETTVTFTQEFNLSSLDKPQPAGTYRLVVVDEEIPGLSFIAYRRSSTMLHLPAISTRSGLDQVFPVDREELESVLKADDLRQHGGKQKRGTSSTLKHLGTMSGETSDYS